MMIAGQEKPSLEELSLEHFGVKGMRWGVVKAKTGIGSAPSGKTIRKARRSVNKQERKLMGQQIRQLGTFNKEKRATRKKNIATMKTNLLHDPDRATAARITRGEKAVLVLLNVGAPIAGTLGTAAVLGGATLQRKRIESWQKKHPVKK
jgi:hypothetical protein